MRDSWKKILVMGLAGILAAVWCEDGLARTKKRHVRHHITPHVSRDLGITRDYDGTPIIMQGFHRTRPGKEPADSANRKVRIPRGSSTYIPPPNPSPDAGPPPAVLVQPSVQPYKPPPINTFGDRVTSCIHSFPLQGGVGNNPSDQQMYIRQCANQ